MELDEIRARAQAQATLPPRRQAKALRVSGGLTVRELAAAVGVSERSVEWWEAGKRRPTGIRLEKYAAVLAAIAEGLGSGRTR